MFVEQRVWAWRSGDVKNWSEQKAPTPGDAPADVTAVLAITNAKSGFPPRSTAAGVRVANARFISPALFHCFENASIQIVLLLRLQRQSRSI
jgi:hypothetical protein